MLCFISDESQRRAEMEQRLLTYGLDMQRRALLQTQADKLGAFASLAIPFKDNYTYKALKFNLKLKIYNTEISLNPEFSTTDELLACAIESHPYFNNSFERTSKRIPEKPEEFKYKASMSMDFLIKDKLIRLNPYYATTDPMIAYNIEQDKLFGQMIKKVNHGGYHTKAGFELNAPTTHGIFAYEKKKYEDLSKKFKQDLFELEQSNKRTAEKFELLSARSKPKNNPFKVVIKEEKFEIHKDGELINDFFLVYIGIFSKLTSISWLKPWLLRLKLVKIDRDAIDIEINYLKEKYKDESENNTTKQTKQE